MMARGVIVLGGLGALLLGGTWGLAEESRNGEVPAAFAPFEYIIGRWKGTGVPTANRVRGWTETHQWAWKFAKGRPVGLSLTLEGGKTLVKGQLTYDPVRKRYVLEGTDPAGASVTFTGALDAQGKTLTLDRTGRPGDGKERLALFPNSNKVRYTMWLSRQEPGAPQFKRVTEVGVTKEGEAFAAGSSAADVPKCIITGGAATLTVGYQGKSYPICCTGCRDEFNENPEKYVKKAALRLGQGNGQPAARAVSAGRGKDDGAFDGLIDGPGEKPRTEMPRPSARSGSRPKTEPSGAPAASKAGEGKAGDAARAASLLRIAQNLEKTGKTAAALNYYKQVVKNHPGTPSAKTAAARVKVLEAR